VAWGTKSKKGVTPVAKKDKEENLFMLMFVVTRSDVLAWANESGILVDQVTDEVIEMLREKIVQGAASWRELLEGMFKEAIKCPLDMVCSSSCPWQEVGKCILPALLNSRKQ